MVVEEDVVVEEVVVVVVVVVIVEGSSHLQNRQTSPETHLMGQWSGNEGVGQPSVRYCGHRPCSDGETYESQLK